MGSNDKETKFRVLEIDRTAGTDLKFYEYPNEYDARGIRSVVGTLGQCKVGFKQFFVRYECETISDFIFARKSVHTVYWASYVLWRAIT